LGQIASFGAAYMTVVLVEPLVDLGVLAAAKGWRRLQDSVFVERRLYGGV
ncbi:cobalt transporter, partial [Clostridium butyricum]|nr:cobalt transporter [Clostridium butyricum]